MSTEPMFTIDELFAMSGDEFEACRTWYLFGKSGRKPDDLLARPDLVLSDWVSWRHFIDTFEDIANNTLK